MNRDRKAIVRFAVATAILCVALMVFSAYTGRPTAVTNLLGGLITPIRQAISAVGDGFGNFFGYFYRYSALQQENEELRARLDEYRDLERRYLSAISENEQLRKLTGLAARYSDFDFEMCQVASVYRGTAQVALSLNKGTNSGVEEGDAVITDGGFVGYVSEAGPTYCEVVTVLDISFEAEARVSRTKETVIAQGDYELMDDGLFKLSFLPPESDIREGDLVETSGYGGVYPQGLILGRVRQVRPDPGGLTLDAVVEPADDLFDLKWVYVVKDFDVVE